MARKRLKVGDMVRIGTDQYMGPSVLAKKARFPRGTHSTVIKTYPDEYLVEVVNHLGSAPLLETDLQLP